MKHEEKAALQAGGTAALIGGVVALAVANPLTWVALAYGTYKIGKYAYQEAKLRGTLGKDQEDDQLFI